MDLVAHSTRTASPGGKPDHDAAEVGGADRVRLDRIGRSNAATTADVAQSLRQLDAIDEGSYDFAGLRARGMAAGAVSYILQHAGMDITTSTSDAVGDDLDAVPVVCDRIGAACRQVILPDMWWRADHGDLVASMQITDGPTRSAIVGLIPSGLGGYVLHNTVSGVRLAVDEALAASIGPRAYVLYPALPQKITGLASLSRFLWPTLRPDLWRVLVAGSIAGAVGLALPVATGVVLDHLIPGRELGLLLQVGAGLLLSAILVGAFRIMERLAFERLNGRSAVMLQNALWNRVLRLPAGFFKNYTSGDLGQRIAGLESMRRAMLDVCLSASVTMIFSLLSFALLVSYDVRLALAALGIVLLQTGIALVAGTSQLRHLKRQAITSGWLSGYVFQVLQAIVKLRIAGAEQRAFARWASRFAEERAAVMATRRISNRYASFADVYAILSLATLYACAGYLGNRPHSAGVLIAFIAGFGTFQSAFLDLANAALRVFAVAPDYERARSILDAQTEKAPRAALPGTLSGEIEISKLCFAYGAGATPVLKDVTISIRAGEHVAIVGPSGSGKSTLLRILLGLEAPQSGTVLYDGQDLASLDIASVRRQIGVVLQTGRVFAGTLLENIRGATNASIEDCELACEAAGLAEDMAYFPMGLHTPLTEGAATISGGQRQRLLIARALVARPRLLFMDEATSALDNRTQAVITESLDSLSVTRLVIAHRLSTVRNADKIIVLDKGQIVETGHFDTLIAQNGLFAALARRQLN